MSKWEWKKLGEVCEIHGRIGWQGLTRKEYRSSGDYLLITGINFTDNNTVDYESCVYVDKERYVQDQYIQVRENDLLITKDGTLGKLALITEKPPKPATLNGGLFVIRNPDDRIYPKFLMYVMMSEPFRKMIKKSITGSTVPHLTQNMLVNFPIPIPSLSEQKCIVKQLDEKTAKIAKFKANAETNLKNAKELFEAALEKELNLNKDEALPSGWEWKKIGDFCETSSGGTPLKQHNEYYENGDIPWLRSGEVCQKEIFETEMCITQKGMENSSAKYFPENSVVVAMYGATAGQVGIIRFRTTTNQAVCGIFPNEKYITEYLYYALLSKKQELVAQAVGGAQPNISQIKIRSLAVPLPPLSVQKEIVARLDKLSENVKRLEANYKQIIADCDELKKSILKKTFEGDSRSSRE